jgi:hypothetical protein
LKAGKKVIIFTRLKATLHLTFTFVCRTLLRIQPT